MHCSKGERVKTISGGGIWRVETNSAMYILNLDERLVWRHRLAVPFSAADRGVPHVAVLRRDGQAIPLLALGHCAVGESMHLVLDVRGDGILTFRVTTPVVGIQRCPAITANDDPDDRATGSPSPGAAADALDGCGCGAAPPRGDRHEVEVHERPHD